MRENDNLKVGFYGGKFLPLHAGHISALAHASTLVDKLYFILFSSEKRDRYYCDRDGIEYITPEQRLVWMGIAISNMENIQIIHLIDEGVVINDIDQYDWKKGSDQVKGTIPEKITHVFSSEPEYTTYFSEFYPDANHIIIDSNKRYYPVSATDIRKDINNHWYYLPDYVRSHFVKKVVLVGTESCGKSTLVKNLAKVFNTNYVHEIGREYCERSSDQFTVEMFDDIVIEHLMAEKQAILNSNRVLFVDTEAVVTQYYLDIYLNSHSEFIDNVIKRYRYDLYIFLEPDVKWVDDGLRFLGDENTRQENNDKLKKMFDLNNIQYHCLSGTYSERLVKAIDIVEKLLSRN